MENIFKRVSSIFDQPTYWRLTRQRGLLQRPLCLYLPICCCPTLPDETCDTLLSHERPHCQFMTVLLYTMHWRRLLNMIQFC